MDNKINSKGYWNLRFSTGDWEKKGGKEQTEYFYNLLLDNLPEAVKENFKKEKLSICDVGCAEGDGTNLLQERFQNCSVTGVDIADAAIEIAKKNYPKIKYTTELNQNYDVVVSSNTLEHFEDPTQHLKELFLHSKKYVVILIPFEEYERIPEHFFTFEYSYFKMKYFDFSLIFFNEINGDDLYWNGKQLLLVFQKNIAFDRITLESLGVASLLHIRNDLIKSQKETINKKNFLITQKEAQIIQTNLELKEKQYIILRQEKEIRNLSHELNTIYNSNFWKLASKYYDIKEKPILKPVIKIGRSIKRYGPLVTIKKLKFKISNFFNKIKSDKQHKVQLQNILKKYPDRTIIILPVLVDWNIPLFQRPQHLAKNLAKEGYLYFYCTGNTQYDQVDGFEEIFESCYLTNRFDLLDDIEGRKKYYDLSSTDNSTDWNFARQRLERGDGVFYQYIDEISDNISGHKVPQQTWEKHNNILKDERFIVIPSATKLENDVKKQRSKNFKLVTNGVEIEHFSKQIQYEEYPEEIKEIVDKGRPVIGYFGAFASWFDYELIRKLAQKRADLEIVLLGVDYDGSIKKAGFEQFDNITVLGPIDYQELPKYAACFDVSTIPFVINDITESTSPIKLFEYMAMGKPIVTTDMPECRKYKSVLIGKTHEEFINKIAQALTLQNDSEYKQTLEKEAHENSWEAKAKDIAKMINV